ncbi:hypothetical protein EZL74_09330 [Flavobacterium silvisoli]|uniref:Uncharacterized protein n=1 Tax=Flavobacterium silvisoli TaxID=2529433 RepID=A0A4Q9YVB8_9FLAO|nr:hypothetical protein [Flavobacterium silvisoli]TBX67675.1 hypothetical protein EZL74_09330 [Flavobacterium silvisoli]
MRKLMLAMMALIGFTLSANAQQTPKKADKAVKETKAPATKKEEVKGPLKKDGTPDKRFKENKEPKGPLKKDGTPDKRFKENKKK